MKGTKVRGAVVGLLASVTLIAPHAAEAKDKKPAEVKIFEGRPDAQKKDRERKLGQGVELSGWTVTVLKGTYKKTVSAIDSEGYLVVDLSLLNRDKKSQTWSAYVEYKLLTPGGEVLDIAITGMPGTLTGGTMVNGATKTGQMVFKVGRLPAAKGRYYVLWKPDAFNADRGVWAIDV